MRLGRQGVFYKIFAPLAFLTVISLIYLLQFWRPSIVNYIIAQSEVHIEKNLQSVSEALVPLILESQLSNVYETLDAVKEKNPHWQEIRLFDSQHRSIYPFEEREIPPQPAHKRFEYQILVNEQSLGRIELIYDFSQLIEDVKNQIQLLLFILLAALTLFLLSVVHTLRRQVGRPTYQLIQASQALSQGNFTHQLEAHPGLNQEMRSLMKSFEHMRSEIQQFREKILESNEQLKIEKLKSEQASAAKSQFLANMSHEIRTPLNGIIGMLELVQRGQLSEQQKEHLRITSQSSELLLTIINDVLEISKIESGKLDIEYRDFDLRRSLEGLTEVFAGRVFEKNLEFPVFIAADIPQMINSDEARINQILLNLIGNAIKFTPSGEISLHAERRGESLFFEVKDTGIGIPENKLKTIFDSFSQADISDTRKYGGSGLGLAISRQVAEAMEGSLTVSSQESVGSSFTLLLPLREVTPADKMTLPNRTTAGILFENQSMINNFTHALSSFGVSCTVLNAPLASKEFLQRTHDSKVFFFIDEKFLHDDEAIALIRESENADFVVVASPLNYFDLRERWKKQVMDVLAKPVKLRELHQVCLSRQPLSRQKEETGGEKKVPLNSSDNRKILLVEDNLINQVVAQAMLTEIGIECDIANNGAEAVEMFRQSSYQLILMDCQMPVMDGFVATQEIRKLEEGLTTQIPIIAMTANAFRTTKEECFASGMNDFITKPVKTSVLEEFLKKHRAS